MSGSSPRWAVFISAVLILYPVAADPWAWTVLRAIIGFSFCGVYITAESWLNNAASNENRGKALSLYLLAQMGGIVTAQGILVLGDPAGFVLFIIPSVLVSISFAPILLSVAPTPGVRGDQADEPAATWSGSRPWPAWGCSCSAGCSRRSSGCRRSGARRPG